MPYEKDIFISYKHSQQEWVKDILIPELTKYLQPYIDPVHFYFDKTSINVGDYFPLDIVDSVINSKCMICMITIPYFKSDWCLTEFGIMLEKSINLGFKTKPDFKGIIFPFVLVKNNILPPVMNGIQAFDCSDYYFEGTAFKGSQQYFQFQKELKKWVDNQLGDFLNSPLDYKSNWESLRDNNNIKEIVERLKVQIEQNASPTNPTI